MPKNQCEETLLGLATEHVVTFAVGWLLLWAVPWWRGVRRYRYALAVLVALVLIAAPLRLLFTADYLP